MTTGDGDSDNDSGKQNGNGKGNHNGNTAITSTCRHSRSEGHKTKPSNFLPSARAPQRQRSERRYVARCRADTAIYGKCFDARGMPRKSEGELVGAQRWKLCIRRQDVISLLRMKSTMAQSFAGKGWGDQWSARAALEASWQHRR